VQDTLESAIATIAAMPEIQVTCAGRTDRGVHARGQVVHFDTDADRPDSAWVRGVNALLPDSVAVVWSTQVAADFHARYAARSRTYRYLLINRPVRPALEARYSGWFHAPLDIEAMRAAAKNLVGEHDFSAFRSSECQAKSPVRSLHSLEIRGEAGRIEFVIRANAFLQHMVRNIVGTLVYVGKGRHAPAWVGEVLGSRDRSRAAPTFSPDGLCLEHVEYGPEWNLPAVQVAPRKSLVPLA
jgi:tRNA pseudouridine38-40 synthase